MDSGDEPTPGIITETVGSYTDEAGNKVGTMLFSAEFEVFNLKSLGLDLSSLWQAGRWVSHDWMWPVWRLVISKHTTLLSWSESGWWSCLFQVSLVMRRYQFRAFRKPRLVLHQMYGEETGKASKQKYFRVQQKCTQGLYLDKTATFHPKQRRK